MGKTAPEAQSGNIVWNGKSFFQLDTGVISFSTASQRRLGAVVAPCDAEIVAANVRMLASATSASAKLRISLNANASGLLTKLAMNGLTASQTLNLMTASTWTAASKKVSKGDLIGIDLIPATAVGSLAVSLIFQPR